MSSGSRRVAKRALLVRPGCLQLRAAGFGGPREATANTGQPARACPVRAPTLPPWSRCPGDDLPPRCLPPHRQTWSMPGLHGGTSQVRATCPPNPRRFAAAPTRSSCMLPPTSRESHPRSGSDNLQETTARCQALDPDEPGEGDVARPSNEQGLPFLWPSHIETPNPRKQRGVSFPARMPNRSSYAQRSVSIREAQPPSSNTSQMGRESRGARLPAARPVRRRQRRSGVRAMSLLGKSCPCDGSNSNCAFCYGTGVLPGPTPPPAQDAESLRVADSTPHGRPRTRVDSSEAITAADGVRPPQEDSCPRLRQERCETCGVLVQANHLGVHHKERHPAIALRGTLRATPDRRSAPAAPASRFVFKYLPTSWACFAPAKAVTCPHCGSRMDQALLPSHLKTAHGIRNPFETVRRTRAAKRAARTAPQARPRLRPAVQQPFNSVGARLTEVLGIGDTMDDSKHTYVRRDHGSFGSHPAHDGFGGESRP